MALGPKPVDKTFDKVDGILNRITCSVVVLRLKAHNCHFNVEGPTFYSDHKTYEGLFETLDGWIDTLGERLRALQYPVCIEIPMLVNDSVIEFECVGTDAEKMRTFLLKDLETLINFIEISFVKLDDTTANILQELSRDLGKQAYFIRSSAM